MVSASVQAGLSKPLEARGAAGQRHGRDQSLHIDMHGGAC
jgi:hypothetical protein